MTPRPEVVECMACGHPASAHEYEYDETEGGCTQRMFSTSYPNVCLCRLTPRQVQQLAAQNQVTA